MTKCYFHQNNIHYLGHIISEQGIVVDLEKIEAIRGWPTPRNVLEVRSFMGLVGYYRRFIIGFSKISHPITSLQKKGTKFECITECEESFNLLKKLLTSSLIFKIIDLSEILLVCTDACEEGISEALTQNGHFIIYESREIK